MKSRALALILAFLLLLCPLAGCSRLVEVLLSPVPSSTDAPAEQIDLPLLSAAPADGALQSAPAESAPEEAAAPLFESAPAPANTPALDENGVYTDKDDIALFLHLYGRLPDNFMTKSDARKLGWSGGGLDGYADGMCIGGDHFVNYEGLLPERKGRSYYECDVGTLHRSSRGSKRIVFSNDGLIYYTSDHYESFTLLYGEES